MWILRLQKQCCGSMKFWYGSGSADPHPLTNGILLFSPVTFKTPTKNYSAYYFLKVNLHRFSRLKVIKKSQNSRNQCLSYYFCLMIEGSGVGSGWIRIREAPTNPDPQHCFKTEVCPLFCTVLAGTICRYYSDWERK
jgi:hypothetical protein